MVLERSAAVDDVVGRILQARDMLRARLEAAGVPGDDLISSGGLSVTNGWTTEDAELIYVRDARGVVGYAIFGRSGAGYQLLETSWCSRAIADGLAGLVAAVEAAEAAHA